MRCAGCTRCAELAASTKTAALVAYRAASTSPARPRSSSSRSSQHAGCRRGVRRLLARHDARMDRRRRQRLRHPAASRPRRRAGARSGRIAAAAMAARALWPLAAVALAVVAIVLAAFGCDRLARRDSRCSRSATSQPDSSSSSTTSIAACRARDIESTLTLWQRAGDARRRRARVVAPARTSRRSRARCSCRPPRGRALLATLALGSRVWHRTLDASPPAPSSGRRLAGIRARRRADRRRHRAVGALFPDRRVSGRGVAGHANGRRSTTRCSGWSKRCGCSRPRSWRWRCPRCVRASDPRPLAASGRAADGLRQSSVARRSGLAAGVAGAASLRRRVTRARSRPSGSCCWRFR